MHLDCPYCGKTIDLEEMIMDADLLACIRMLDTFTPHANLVAAYTELFGITPLRTKRKKWRLLLEEMKRLFDSESFTFDRSVYSISRAGIAEALSLVVHRHWTSKLENHNYLKKIMIGIAEREGKAAGKVADAAHRQKEARLMSGNRDAGTYPVPEEQVEPRPVTSRPSDDQIEKNREHVKTLLGNIGGKRA